MYIVPYSGQLKTYQITGSDSHLQPLVWFKEQSATLDPTQYPITISEGEKSAINFDHVITVIKNEAKSPSQLAGLVQSKRTEWVKIIDEAFQEAMESYKDNLDKAVRKDKENVSRIKTALKVSLDHSNYAIQNVFWRTIASFIGFIHRTVTGARTDGLRDYLVGNVANVVRDLVNKQKQTLADTEMSANRRVWLIQTDYAEKKRLESATNIAKNRLITLVDTIKSIGKTEWDRGVHEEVSQLYSIYQAINPDEGPLIINDVDIKSYILTKTF